MNRQKLLRLRDQANETGDMDEAYALYTDILDTQGLSLKLKPKEILDIRLKYAANNVEIANWYESEKGQYTRAHTHMGKAVENALQCVNGYQTTQDIDEATTLLNACQGDLNRIIEALRGVAATVSPRLA